VTAPDGTTTADAVFETAASGFHAIQRGLAIPSTAIYTASFFVKANGRTQFALQIGIIYAEFNLSAETAAVIGGGASDAASILALPNGWYRCTFTRSATADETVFMVFNNGSVYDYTGNAALGFYIWGAQLEAGAFPTSYIPTTSAAVTRSADSAVVTPISAFYNQSEGTLFAEATPKTESLHNGFQRVLLTANDNTDLNQITIGQGGSGNLDKLVFVSFINAGGGTAEMFGGSGIAGSTQKAAGAYKASDFAFSVNGGAVDTEASGSPASGITHLFIGRRPADGFVSGHIRKIAYWPRRLSNALLQSLTT
jgi:hypothetical protein